MPSGVYKRKKPPWNKGLSKEEAPQLKGGRPKGRPSWNKGLKIGHSEAQLAADRSRPAGSPSRIKQQASLTAHNEMLDSEARKQVYGHEHTLETRQLLREMNLGKTYSAETRERVSKAGIGRKHTSTPIQKMKDSRAALWQDPEYVQKQMKARGVSPNAMELAAAKRLSPLGFRFVGDGELIINGKCPDFWNGDMKLIELYGDYWHRNDDPQDRINLFKAAGYDCLVIWEHELKEDIVSVMVRVEEFVS